MAWVGNLLNDMWRKILSLAPNGKEDDSNYDDLIIVLKDNDHANYGGK